MRIENSGIPYTYILLLSLVMHIQTVMEHHVPRFSCVLCDIIKMYNSSSLVK